MLCAARPRGSCGIQGQKGRTPIATHTLTGTCQTRSGGIAGWRCRLAYMLLWPHTKPWHLMKPQPSFRDIPDVEAVATRLAFTLGGQMPVIETQTAMPEDFMVPAE